MIIDGMGDRPLKELGYKTPLESAKTPNMDKLAEISINGIMDPISPGIRAGSDTSHISILGYDPYEVYTGRGPFEAAGVGVDVLEVIRSANTLPKGAGKVNILTPGPGVGGCGTPG